MVVKRTVKECGNFPLGINKMDDGNAENLTMQANFRVMGRWYLKFHLTINNRNIKMGRRRNAINLPKDRILKKMGRDKWRIDLTMSAI